MSSISREKKQVSSTYKSPFAEEEAIEKAELDMTKHYVGVWGKCLQIGHEKYLLELEELIRQSAINEWGEGTKCEFYRGEPGEIPVAEVLVSNSESTELLSYWKIAEQMHERKEGVGSVGETNRSGGETSGGVLSAEPG